MNHIMAQCDLQKHSVKWAKFYFIKWLPSVGNMKTQGELEKCKKYYDISPFLFADTIINIFY